MGPRPISSQSVNILRHMYCTVDSADANPQSHMRDLRLTSHVRPPTAGFQHWATGTVDWASVTLYWASGTHYWATGTNYWASGTVYWSTVPIPSTELPVPTTELPVPSTELPADDWATGRLLSYRYRFWLMVFWIYIQYLYIYRLSNEKLMQGMGI